jgi:hypothetical protein
VKLYATTATNNLVNIFMVSFVSGAPLTRFPLKLWLCECYRYGACVGVCDATYEVMLAPSLEIAPKLWRPQKRKLFGGRFCETPFEGAV